MFPIQLAQKILTQYNGLSFYERLGTTPSLITAIQKIPQNVITSNRGEYLTCDELWLIAEAFKNDEKVFDGYKAGLDERSRANLIKIIQIFTTLKKNNKLDKTSLDFFHVYGSRGTTNRALNFIDTCQADPLLNSDDVIGILINDIDNWLIWEVAIKLLRDHELLTLDNIKKIAVDVKLFNKNYTSNKTTYQRGKIYSKALITILLNDPKNKEAAETFKALSEKINVDLSKSLSELVVKYNITSNEALSQLNSGEEAENIEVLKSLNQGELEFIIPRLSQYNQWKILIKFLKENGILNVANLIASEKNLQQLSNALRNSGNNGIVKFNNPQSRLETMNAQPEYIEIMVKNEGAFEAIKSLVEKRKISENVIVSQRNGLASIALAVDLLRREEMLDDADIDFLIENISLGEEIYNCLSILSKSGLKDYYGNILDKETVGKIKPLSSALSLLSRNGQITKEAFEAAWNFPSEFSKAQKILKVAIAEECGYMLIDPRYADIIAKALLIIRNDRLEDYKHFVSSYPEHSEKLLSGIAMIRSEKHRNLFVNVNSSDVITVLGNNPAYADTMAKAYIMMREKLDIPREGVLALIKQHPKYALDIAEARATLNKLNFDTDNIQEFLLNNVPYEIEGKEEFKKTDASVVIDNKKLHQGLMKVQSNYAYLLLGNLHAKNGLSISAYFQNAYNNYRRIPKTSGCYLAAQRGLYDLLLNHCLNLVNEPNRKEELKTYKNELVNTIMILKDNAVPEGFLEKSDELLEDIANKLNVSDKDIIDIDSDLISKTLEIPDKNMRSTSSQTGCATEFSGFLWPRVIAKTRNNNVSSTSSSSAHTLSNSN